MSPAASASHGRWHWSPEVVKDSESGQRVNCWPRCPPRCCWASADLHTGQASLWLGHTLGVYPGSRSERPAPAAGQGQLCHPVIWPGSPHDPGCRPGSPRWGARALTLMLPSQGWEQDTGNLTPASASRAARASARLCKSRRDVLPDPACHWIGPGWRPVRGAGRARVPGPISRASVSTQASRRRGRASAGACWWWPCLECATASLVFAIICGTGLSLFFVSEHR